MIKNVYVISILLISLLISCSNASNNNEYGKGKLLKLEFETNPSTGYDWEFKFEEGDNKAVIGLEQEDYILKDTENLVGSSSVRIYNFVATKPGKQKLTFTYRRPWEGGGSAYDVVYELNVDDELNISCISKKKGKVETDKDISFFPDPIFEN